MRHSAIRTGRVSVLAFLLPLLLATGPFLHTARPTLAASPFVVTLATDQNDVDIADDRCDIITAPGLQCTLRAAIQEANNTLGPDTITFNIPGSPNQTKIILVNDPATPGGPNGPLAPLT